MVAAGMLLLVARPSAAQVLSKPVDQSIVPFSTLYGTVGRMNADPTGINSHFSRPDLPGGTGFSALSNDAYSIGVGGYTPIARILLGFDWNYADFGYETSPLGKTNRAETSNLMVTAGLPLYTTWRFTFYPYVGIGGGAMRVTLKSRDGGPTVPLDRSPTFDEIILSPGSESQVIGKYFMVQPGLGFDYLMLADNPTSHFGVTLGIRFATIITPNRTPWTYRGHEVFGGPTFQPSGGTLRLIVGIGGFKLAKE